MRKILIAEDNVEISDMMRNYLKRAGHIVYQAYDGEQALDFARSMEPDLVLLDIMMPIKDGYEVCRTLRKEMDIPIIVVSAKVAEEDKERMFALGADDYLTKPFAPKELLARIAVQFRNTPVKNSDALICFDDLTLNPILHEVSAQGKTGKLTRTESAIFRLLLQNPGQVITKSAILDRICEDTPDCTESSLKVHISNLRKKLAELCGKDYIESVWGICFRLRTLKS